MSQVNVRAIYSIKTKFVATAAAIVALSSIICGSWFLHHEEAQLAAYLENNGRLLLTSLRVPIVSTLLHQEMESAEMTDVLYNSVEEIVSSHDYNTVYLFIVDKDRKILAHSLQSEYGKIADDPLTIGAQSGTGYLHRIVGDKDSSDAILDIALPLQIYGKSWGTIRAGLSLKPMHMQMRSTRRMIWTFSLLFFLVGTTLFYVVGVIMTRPLLNLSRIMTDVNPATLETVFSSKRKDEIGQLQSSFSAMIERLKLSETERRQALALLIQHEKLASIGALVAGVAHEVNNPLAAISCCIYNLEQNAAEKTHEDISVLKQGFTRIENIVKLLSDFSHAGNLNVQAVTSDTFFHEATSFARMALKMRPVVFKATDRCEPPLELVIDKGKLHQVILNLLLNAAKASPRGGTIEFSAYLSPGQYCLALKDQGQGVPVEAQEKIFELLYTTKPTKEGGGIGLAICKTIVDMHLGTLQVESTPGETTFTIKIPVMTETNSVHL
jgi:two-component system NtrC family sensor kinase